MSDMLQLVVALDKNQPQMDEVMSGGVTGRLIFLVSATS